MTKGQQTKEMILEKTAQLFSTHGYFGSSLSDIMRTTGLKKAGIYNYFESKDVLAKEAFDYAYGLILKRRQQAFEGKTNAVDRLLAILGVFQSLVVDPPLLGGCPVLNTAVESDDALPDLRDKAWLAMEDWHEVIRRTVTEGIEQGQIRAEVDGRALASVMSATLEGAVMLCKLYRDKSHMQRAIAHLTWYIETAVKA
jgi:TetR/AcrR family transcriptional repressor of nem operon